MPLSSEGGFFDAAPRRCKKCEQSVNVPARIVFGNGAVTEYCSCGGELERIGTGIGGVARGSCGQLDDFH